MRASDDDEEKAIKEHMVALWKILEMLLPRLIILGRFHLIDSPLLTLRTNLVDDVFA